MDAKPADPLAPLPRPPDPALLAEEERLWNVLLESFEQEPPHNEYLGFCLRNNLLIPCSKRYGAFADDPTRSIDQRRVARLHQQRIAKILFMVPDQPRTAGSEPPSKIELVGVFAGVLAVLIGFGWGLADPKRAVIAIPLGAMALVALGYYLYRKIKTASEKFEKTTKD